MIVPSIVVAADTIFPLNRGQYKSVVCLYHGTTA
jgi:hypothetical protein